MSKLETETSAAKTIQAYKDSASQIGLVLKPGDGIDNGDFPRHAYTNLRYIRRVNAVGKEHRKIIRNMNRQLVTVKDEKGKPIRKEVLWYSGKFRAANHRGIVYGAEFEIGRYQKPKIVPNSNLTFNPNTGEPIGNEKILAGQETVYEITVPKGKQERKKLIDSIIGDDNYADSIRYYYRQLDQNNIEQKRDGTFTYDDFVNSSIDELKDMSEKSGGSKGSRYYRDKDSNLRTKDGTLVTRGNAGAYQ